jgi:hypothetical protein
MFTEITDRDKDADEKSVSFLEQKFIAEYLHSKGFRRTALRNLPETQRKALMKEACIYAASKLAEIESKSKFRRKIEPP